MGTAINSFTSLEMVVISRYVRSQFFVRPIGGDFEPTDDKNVLLRIPKHCFPYNTNIYFKVNVTLKSFFYGFVGDLYIQIIEMHYCKMNFVSIYR